MPISAEAAIPKPPNNLGLIGYWSFNEGTSTVAHDFSGNGNHGVLTNMDSNTDWVNGKRGKALDFDGTNDLVDAGTVPQMGSYMTAAAWVKFSSSSGADDTIIGKDNGTQRIFAFYRASAATLRFFVFVGGVASIKDHSFTPTPNTWYHLVGTYDGSNVRIYINGVDVGSPTAKAGVMDTSSVPKVMIGDDQHSVHEPLAGVVDEARLYNRALSAAEIAALYNSGAVRLGATRTDIVTDGLVGHWTFDGTEFSDKVYDRSGQGKHAYVYNAATSTVKTLGRIGQGIAFDGVDDKIAFSTINAGATNTVAVWVKTADTDGVMFGKTNSSAMSFRILGSNVIYATVSGTVSIAHGGIADTWTHLAATREGTAISLYKNGEFVNSGTLSANDAFQIDQLGVRSAQSYLTGSLDDARVYTRVLSAREIKQLYSLGSSTAHTSQNAKQTNGLIGYWSFDGADFTDKVYDRSNTGSNHGYVIGTATSSVKTIGKTGQGIILAGNGSGQYLTMGSDSSLNVSNTITVSAWVKSTFNFGSVSSIMFGAVSRMQAASPYKGYELGIGGNYMSASNKAYFHVGGAYLTNTIVGTTNLNDGRWHNIVGVYNGTTSYLYVDGVLQTSANKTHDLAVGSENFDIGINYDRNANGHFNGSIDEVRVYNRALSASEVKQLYNMGL